MMYVEFLRSLGICSEEPIVARPVYLLIHGVRGVHHSMLPLPEAEGEKRPNFRLKLLESSQVSFYEYELITCCVATS